MSTRAVLRFGLGGMRLAMIDDGSFQMPLNMFTGAAPEGEAESLLASYGLPTEAATVPLAVMLVETGGACAVPASDPPSRAWQHRRRRSGSHPCSRRHAV